MNEQRTVVAIYMRVSSDDQRNRETIKTQQDVVERYLAVHDELEVYRWYRDDGISGTVPMSQRPDGALLLRDAADGRFQVIIVVRPDRLGRNTIDLLQLYALFEHLGIGLIGISEAMGDQVMFGIKAVLSGDERRKFLQRSKEGMERAAREGRFIGGIVPFGFRVDGKQHLARLVPDEEPYWNDWSPAAIVRQVYAWLDEGWSCVRIADRLNELGVPTAYAKDDRLVRRGIRKQRTQNVWRAGRIRNLVVATVYKGEYHYGKRSKTGREPIVSQVPAIVSADLWERAQQALADHRIMRKKTKRVHLLRSLLRCNICRSTFAWTLGRHDDMWYRCNRQISYALRGEPRCSAFSIKGETLEPLVWADVERWLREPGPLLDELVTEQNNTSASASQEAERLMLEHQLDGVSDQRNAILGALRRKKITEDECDRQMDEIAEEARDLRKRLAALAPADTSRPEPVIADDLLAEIRRRLDDGLDDEMRYEIIQLLVRSITVNTTDTTPRAKKATIVIEYRFPAVAQTHTGTGSCS